MRPFHLLALDTWHDEIQAGERSPHTRDPLFWAASKCADAIVAAEIDWHIQAAFYHDIYKILKAAAVKQENGLDPSVESDEPLYS